MMESSRAKTSDEIEQLRAKTDYLNPSISAEWAKKRLMWVPSEKDGFALGAVIGSEHADNTVDVELMETGERQRVSLDDCQKPNPPKYDKCEDMSYLTCLNEASVLHNLKQRYFSNLYYTYSGLFCVVINPYKRIPIYTDTIAEQFKGKKRKEMPPHVFAVAEEAYRSMLQERDDQSILCTGESGAGKTENTKKVIQYLAYVANRSLKHRKASVDLDTSTNRLMGQLEEQLLRANPILEAFGNSKTVKNDNSSRFGKFIRVHFDGTGCISGANIEFYLLEKSRVLKQSPNERSFHIFYQLLKGLSRQEREKYLLEDSLSKYKFITNGESKLAGVDDAEEMKQTREAMNIMGLNDDEIAGILRVVSAVMLMGNLEFSQENKNNDQAVLANDAVAQKIASLLGVNVTELMRAFLKPKIKVQRDLVHRAQSVDQVYFSVGAIAKASYERLFRWLVHRLNKSLDRTRQQSVSFIGILDIAGFEIFDSNSFEQLCINYTNEKLQQLFNHTMFSREQQEYIDEGIKWEYIDFGLNLQPTIDLIDKPMGILSTLDDVCLFPQGSDQSLVQRLNDTHNQHPKYVVPEIRARSDFAVVHYAGRVDYQAAGWRVKNMDPLNDNVIDLLKASKEPLIVDMWKDVTDVCSLSAAESTTDTGVFGSRLPKKGMFRTVSQLYKEQLGRLMTTLQNTNPHFVRCIIPNHEKRHGMINAHLILDQLRCNGVLEGIRICRQGFPTRLPFQEFRQRYEKLLAPEVNPTGFMDGKEAVCRIVNALEIEEQLFRIGQSKIFFRAGVVAELEEMRDQKLASLMEAFQARCRGWLGRRVMVRRRQQDLAIKIIQRNGLAWMRLREWQWWRLFTKVKPLLEVTNKDELIAEKEMELKATSERLRRSEVFIADYKQQMEKMDEERAVLKTRLDAESSERAEMFEERSRIAARKIELETILEDMSKRLETEEQKAKSADTENRRLMDMVRHLEENLEDEERSRQKLMLEKNSIESRLKEIEVQGAELEDSGVKLAKEKKVLEERCGDLSSRLIDEEERSKQLVKVKARLEATIAETNDELEKEKQQRHIAETARRAAETQLREEQEACLEKTRKAEELSNQLMRKESELSQINIKNDEELAARQQLEREIREIRAQLDDAVEEANKEKAARQKAEKARRDMAEELESYKQELEESNDKSVLHSQLKAKRDEEYAHLQRQLEETLKTSDDKVEEMKALGQKKIEELNEVIDQLKRQKVSADKVKSSVEADNENIRAELANVASARTEAEKKRKAAEAALMEREHKMREMQTNLEDLMAKLNKMNGEMESIQKAKSAEEVLNSNLLKKNASLDMQLTELTEASEEDRRNRTNLNSKIRQLEEELAVAIEAKEDALAAQEKSDKEAKELRTQLAEARKKLDEENREVMEEIRKKKEKELLAEKERADAAEQAREKAERAKKKAIQEAEDVQKELTDVQAALRDFERKQRKFDQQLADERNNTVLALQERDSAQQQLRDAETKALVLANELAERKDAVEALEKERRTLKLEIDNLASTKDDAGKNVYELEKTKRRLDEELSRAEQQIIELEDALQIADDARSRVEINMQALRADLDRQLATRDEEEEERKKSLASKLRNVTEELESEQRARQAAVAAKKKFELQIAELSEKNEAAQRHVDDLTRQLRKAQLGAKDVQLDVVEARAAMEDAMAAQRDAEKRARNSEDEIKRLSAELQAVSSSRRKAEAERDELSEEVATLRASSFSNEEKRRLEAKVLDLEDQLDEEASANELAQEKVRKAQQQLEQMTADLAMERSLCERNETERNSLERANRELKQQLQEAETSAMARLRTQITVAETKVHNLEQTLSLEESEKTRQARALRRLETKIGEMVQQLEEERREGESNRQAVDRQNARIRQLRAQLEDTEAERDRLNNKLRDERRRAEEMSDLNETLSRDVSIMRQRETTARRTPGLGHRDASRRFGSNTSLARDDFRGSAINTEMSPSERPSSRLTSGTGSQLGNTDEDHDSVRN